MTTASLRFYFVGYPGSARLGDWLHYVKAHPMRNDEFEGKVFRGNEGIEYGVIRSARGSVPADLLGAAFAEDSCGNYFVLLQSGAVAFWDHETSKTTLLSESLSSFIAALRLPEPVQLREGQLKSVWVDPAFAKEFGLRSGSK